MNTDKQIEKMLSSIKSLENVINDMQIHVENMHGSHQELRGQVFEKEGAPSPEMEQQFEDIKSHVSGKMNHIENLISNTLDADKIGRKINKMRLLEERINHWNKDK